MKPATRLLTVAVLVACAWWRMRPVPAVHAQIMQCDSYDRRTDYPCNSCCSAGNTSFNNITAGFVEGAGMETIVQTYQDCGKSVSCPGPTPTSTAAPRILTERLTTRRNAACRPAIHVIRGRAARVSSVYPAMSAARAYRMGTPATTTRIPAAGGVTRTPTHAGSRVV